MCELLTMSCRHPDRLTTSLSTLASHAQGECRNRDGWGMAFYQGSDVALYRDTVSADESLQLQWLESHGPDTTLAAGYIRHATQGAVCLANTGPFIRELHGRMHVFTHNGSMPNLAHSPLNRETRFQPVGETDSELAFCLLLERMARLEQNRDDAHSLQRRLESVAAMASELRSWGPATFCYADGEVLFAHADRRFQPVTQKIAAPALFQLVCPDQNSNALQRECGKDEQRMVLLASTPLSEEGWQPMAEGEVIAVCRGEIVARLNIT